MRKPRQIVITGVSKGLGRALVDQFIQLGMTVSGCARNENAIQSLQDQYPDHHFAAVDVANRNHVDRWATQIVSQVGPPDLLLNNAAVIPANAPLWEVPPDDFEHTMRVNISGVFNVVRAFVPSMIQRDQGIIVNFSSTWGRSVAPEVAPYCATKWAIEGMTQALAAELPHSLAAIPFNPGIIQTDMLDSCLGSASRMYPKPEDWAAPAADFLLDLQPSQSGQPLSAPSV